MYFEDDLIPMEISEINEKDFSNNEILIKKFNEKFEK